MNKKIKYVSIIIITLTICYEIITHSNIVILSMQNAYDIWIKNVFSSLFPIMVISNILIDIDFPKLMGKITKPIMRKIFNLNSNCAFIFIISMISGSPNNALTIKELYKDNLISIKDASKMLIFTHFTSPLFILGTISSLLENKKAGTLIFVIHYLTNILMALILRNNKPNIQGEKTKQKKEEKDISEIITSSIYKSMNTLLMILGVICISNVLIKIIIENFNFSETTNCIISGLIEMTNGIKMLSKLDLNLKIKTTLSIFFISFGGISIHLQILSVINDIKVKYKFFLLGRIIHALISSILTYILFDIFI